MANWRRAVEVALELLESGFRGEATIPFLRATDRVTKVERQDVS